MGSDPWPLTSGLWGRGAAWTLNSKSCAPTTCCWGLAKETSQQEAFSGAFPRMQPRPSAPQRKTLGLHSRVFHTSHRSAEESPLSPS